VSKSINFWDATIVPEMYLPSGDQWGEKYPAEPGKVETRRDFKSRIWMAPFGSEAEPKITDFPSGDQPTST
jgi:hypothetical protein